MKILINLAGIMGHDSQEVYAKSVLEALLPKLNNARVYVVLPRYFPVEIFQNSEATLFRISFLDNRIFSVFFTQCILPLYVLFLGIQKIYSPTIIFPVLFAKRTFPTIHDLDYANEESAASGLAKKYIRTLDRIASQKSKKCFTVSHAIAGEASKKYRVPLDRFIVVHSALPAIVPIGETQPAIERPFFLYVGMYRRRKNVEFLIKAYAGICNEVSESLVLAGSVNSHQAALLQLAREQGCEDRIIFTGYVSDERKSALYENATAVVFPSLYEGFGFPILEAHAHRVPILLSDIPVFHEIAGKGGKYFDPHNQDTLAESMKVIACDPALRTKLIDEGSDNLANFSWEKAATIIASTI